jgi:hypothetical protein
MNLREFTARLALDLRDRGIPYERRRLEVFAASVWPLALDDPDLKRWTAEFVAALKTSDTAA